MGARTRMAVCSLVIDEGLGTQEAAKVLGISHIAIKQALKYALELGEIERVDRDQYRWASDEDESQPELVLTERMLQSGVCPLCGCKRSEHPREWVQINGHWRHFTENCLRRRLRQAAELIREEE